MADYERTFTVTTGDALISMIERAKHRLVVFAPVLSRVVADALAARFNDQAVHDGPIRRRLLDLSVPHFYNL